MKDRDLLSTDLSGIDYQVKTKELVKEALFLRQYGKTQSSNDEKTQTDEKENY